MIVCRPSSSIAPCQPPKVARPPSGPLWVHEIKHDGYRRMVRRDGSRVRCFTRNGHDWADRLRRSGDAAVLYAFDLIEHDGDDLSSLSLLQRKRRLARLLGRAKRPSIQFVGHLMGDGPTIFDHVCRLGLEGIVSKRTDAPYRSGPSKAWLKAKNPASEAVRREREEEWR